MSKNIIDDIFIKLGGLNWRSGLAIVVFIVAATLAWQQNYEKISTNFSKADILNMAEGLFQLFEILVLIGLSVTSTTNYVKAINHHTNLGIRGRILVFSLLNFAFFLIALSKTGNPNILILAIIGIYSIFLFCNFNQISDGIDITVRTYANSLPHKQYVIEQSGFLKEENFPSLLGYIVIYLFVLGVDGYDKSFGNHHHGLHHMIEAFTAGAALLHLSLSVYKYFYVLKQKDTATKVIRELEWNDKATTVLTNEVTLIINAYKPKLVKLLGMVFFLTMLFYVVV